MRSKFFGLDIGTTTIKAVWLDKTKAGHGLCASTFGQTPPRGMLSESLTDQEEMANSIKKILSDARISAPYANVALSESHVYTKILEMPLMSDSQLMSAIYWEAEQYIPVPLTTVTIDWKVLYKPGAKQTGEKMLVLLVGAPTQLLHKYQKILTNAGVTIAAIETEMLSVIRALGVDERFPPSILVNIGSLNTSLAIVQNGILIFTYAVPIGGGALNRAIATDFNFSEAQAEEYKRTYGIAQNMFGGKIGQVTEPILMAIITELKKALAFYQSRTGGGTPIQQIILTGGTAKLQGLDLYFANKAGIETVIANPWRSLFNFQNLSKELNDNATDYTVAVGLALRDYEE